ncbi:MAG: hypothetical protein H8D67_15735 [Deltaproteobacteria bacterium]|nr:hypothetical protein [Deltaproteobacteria bacterium]
MELNELYQIAKQYEKLGQEHTNIDYSQQMHKDIDICAHLHHEVSELWDAIRKQKPKEDIIDELCDILGVWMVAVYKVEEHLGESIDVNELVRFTADIVRGVAKRKFNVEI